MKKWISDCNQAFNQLEHQCMTTRTGNNELNGSHEFKKKNWLALTELWQFLQTKAETERNLLVFPSIRADGLKCDALMITAGGIYLYHLLPNESMGLFLRWPTLEMLCNHSNQTWTVGESRRAMQLIARQFNLDYPAIYEIYITPPELNQRFVFDETLVLTFEQLTLLFDNLVFRESNLFEKQHALEAYLLNHRSLDNRYGHLSILDKESGKKDKEPNFGIEEQSLSQEMTSLLEQASPTSQPINVLETVMSMPPPIPPRRRKEQRKAKEGWLQKLFGKKYRGN